MIVALDDMPSPRLEAMLCAAEHIKNGYRLLAAALQDTDEKYHLTNRRKDELGQLRAQQQRKSIEQEMREAQHQAHLAQVGEFNATWANLSDDEQVGHWSAFLASAECAPLLAVQLIKPTMAPVVTHPACAGPSWATCSAGQARRLASRRIRRSIARARQT